MENANDMLSEAAILYAEVKVLISKRDADTLTRDEAVPVLQRAVDLGLRLREASKGTPLHSEVENVLRSLAGTIEALLNDLRR